MRYTKIEEIKKEIEEKIKLLPDDVDDFVSENFQQYLVGGEYSDNTMETSDYYERLKSIEADKEFWYKMRFVLDKFVRA